MVKKNPSLSLHEGGRTKSICVDSTFEGKTGDDSCFY
jgi:hypothetical protein